MADFLNCTVGDLLAQAAARHPDRPALIYSDRDLRYSYGELDHRVSQVAKGLLWDPIPNIGPM